MPPWPRAMPKHGLWGFCFSQATKALWEIIHLPLSPEALIVAPSLFVALLVQVFCSSEEMPEDINILWRRWQKREHFPTNPKRCSIPVFLSLPCPWTLGQGSRHDLSFALHTGL